MANKWTNEQQLAIDKQNANILVSASAGSGKTAVLVERVINKVIKYNIDIDKILVVTFTNASAVELKERLLLAIYKELDKSKNNLFLKRQLQYINRASITTIHSFCLDIIRQNFYILNLDPNFKICDESQSVILKTKAMNKILEQKYIEYSEKNSNQDVGLYKVLRLFSGKEENMGDILFKLYSYIQSFDYPFEWLEYQINKYNIDIEKNENLDLIETEFGKEIFNDAILEIEILSKRIEDMLDILRGQDDFLKYIEMLDSDNYSLRTCLKSSSWEELYENLNSMRFVTAPRKFSGSNIELKDSILNLRDEVVKKTIKKLSKSIYTKSINILKENKSAYEYIRYIFEMLKDFDIEYKKLKEEENLIDFNDIEHLALNLLVNKNGNEYELTDVAKNVQKKFSEVYTDEYQDTSFIQEAILEAVSGSKNRFMVGDIKQSIYRFRQAMPEIFNKKYDDYSIIDDSESSDNYNCKIVLAKNFRSRSNVIDSINYIFTRIMSKENGDCDYSDIETLKFGATLYEENKDVDYTTEVNIIDLKSANADNDIEIESQDNDEETLNYIKELKDFEIESICIAKKIQELMQNFKVYNINNKEFTNLKYKDIVILLRGIKDKGTIIENTLKKYGIPAFSDATTSLFDSDEVKLVLSFLRVISNPLQDIHMISIMYSIIGNFTLSELAIIRSYNSKEDLYYNINEKIVELRNKEKLSLNDKILLNKLINFSEILNKFMKISRVYKVSDLLTIIYKDTNIYYQFATQKSAKIKKSNLDLLLEYAIKYESESDSNIDSYISYIDKLIENPNNSNSTAKILGENEDVVRIMTIHKSKGLEFPVVILCDTSKKYNVRDSHDYITMHHKFGIGINVVDDNYNVTYPSVIKQAIKSATVKDTKSEELRMLYVALTRAKEKLIIFSTVKDYEQKIKSQFVMYKENAIDPVIVSKNNNYFDNILMSLNDYNNDDNIFKINIINPVDVVTSLSEQENIIDMSKIMDNIKKENDINITNLKENIEKIKEHMNYTYEFSKDTNVKKRVSVSELKKPSLDDIEEADIITNTENIDLEFNIPDCINDENTQKYTPVRKGTLVHFVLEHLDFKKINTREDIKGYIEELINENIITKSDANQIDINNIYNFICSGIGIKLKNSKEIHREEEFVLIDKQISKSIIQGIIDLYYIDENDNIILVDFKTDRLNNRQDFIDKYEKQLYIYKEAIEKLINKKVYKVYIYSFNLNTEIEISYDERKYDGR